MVGLGILGVPDLICLQLLNGFLCIGLRDNANSCCSITKAVRNTHLAQSRTCKYKYVPGSAIQMASQ